MPSISQTRDALKRLSAFQRLATPETDYGKARNLGELLRIILAGDKPTLKSTAKVKAAINAMQAVIAESADGWLVNDSGIREYGAEVASGAQKSVFPSLKSLAKSTRELQASMHNGPKATKGNAKVADLFVLYAMLEAVKSAKGSTEERGKFLLHEIPALATRAGGSSLQNQLVAAVKAALPWKDVTKMRKQRGLEASVGTSSQSADWDVLQYYMNPDPMPMQSTYTDTVFQWLKADTADHGWMALPKVEDALTVMTAPTFCNTDRTRVLEKSKQLMDFIQDLATRFDMDYRFANIRAPHEGGVSLADLVMSQDPAVITRLLTLATKASWYNQLVVDGKQTGAQKAAYAAYVLACLRLVEDATTDAVRAEAFITALAPIVGYGLMPVSMLLARLRFYFPWSVVVAMLRHRAQLG